MKMGGLSKKNTTALRGIMALIIIVAHCRNHITALHDTLLGMVLTASGYLVVGVFFFLSAYGMREQLYRKGEPYLQAFPRNRILTTYVTYVFAIGIYVAVGFMLGSAPEWTRLLQSFLWGDTIVRNGWYLQAALLLYLLFWCVYQKERKYNWLLILLMYGAACLLVEGTLWFQSILCFGLGLLWSEKKAWIGKMMRHWWLVFVLSFLLFCATLLLGNLPLLHRVPMVVCKMLSACFFVIWVAALAEKVSFANVPANFMGTISYELYVVHGVFLDIFGNTLTNYWLIPVIIGCSLPAAWILHFAFRKIQTAIRTA